MTIEVVKPGLFSTFQDLGRVGHQHLGVPVSGAMDEVAHRVANLLVGNDEAEATLEVTLIGPTLRFREACTIAICGADLEPMSIVARHVAQPIALWTPIDLASGATLRFGTRRSGMRAYVALRGGFDIPRVMGSRSTHVRGAMGGFEGRALRAGDSLRQATRALHLVRNVDAAIGRCLWRVQTGNLDAPIRVLEGREWARFTRDSQAAFLANAWRIGVQSDRMAYRMETDPSQGAVDALARTDDAELLSEAVANGSVQVPSDGRPIVLMADRQSTGGYARIAQVASIDLPRLAQRMPGESIRFERVSHDHAEHLLLKRAMRLDELRAALKGRST